MEAGYYGALYVSPARDRQVFVYADQTSVTKHRQCCHRCKNCPMGPC